MKKVLALAVAGAVLTTLLASGGSVGAQAQVDQIAPVPYNPANCTAARYDLNGDGVLNKKDVNYFDEHARPCLDRYGMHIPGSSCEPKLDVNRDGKVDRYDLDYLYRFILSCLKPTSSHTRVAPVTPIEPPVEP